MKAAHVLISGRVQGMGFRSFIQNKAAEFNVSGWIRNLGDGRVEAWFEGDDERIDLILESLETGPPSAEVSKIEIKPKDPAGLTGFERRPTA